MEISFEEAEPVVLDLGHKPQLESLSDREAVKRAAMAIFGRAYTEVHGNGGNLCIEGDILYWMDPTSKATFDLAEFALIDPSIPGKPSNGWQIEICPSTEYDEPGIRQRVQNELNGYKRILI